MKALERLTPEAAASIRVAIRDAGGNEVFASGRLDQDGYVAEINIAARGTLDAVLALDGFLDRGDVLIHNHPSGRLEASQADMSIASRVGQNGVGSFIVDNEVENLYVVTEPIRKRALLALNSDQLASVLEPGGKLAARTGNFESRPSQVDLVRSVTDAMNEGYILAAEAGTGVGKSFAYLVPAFAWAARNEERVVISTATINLQRQLMDKDIPRVASIFKKELKSVLVKGRGNFLCQNRLREALDEEGLFLEADSPLKAIEAWADSSPSGDRADLSFWPEDALWNRVCSESDDCLGLRCPFREDCFILKKKREAADADVIVANHHILFSDLASRAAGSGYEATAVLPPYNMIIFDEAHAIESSATSFMSLELAKFSVYRQLGRLYRERRGRKFGLITKLQNIKNLPPAVLKKIPQASDAVRAASDKVDLAGLDLLGDALNWRLTTSVSGRASILMAAMGELERSVLLLSELLKDALDEVPDESKAEQSVHEAGLALMRFSELASLCAKWRDWHDNDGSIFWIEKARTREGDSFARLYVTPLDIGTIMNESVYEPFRSVLCLSATLSVGGRFDYWKNRVGLSRSDHRALCLEFPSPFPFHKNALLAAIEDAPMPDAPGWQDWINEAIAQLLEASEGHALVLFTSYASLRSAWEVVKPKLDQLGISAFRQGDDERSRLMEKFKADISSVLFATDSFWEGVDAPGDTLQLVIMTKLPFRVPTDPVQMARSEAIEAKGGNSFMDLSLPEAVIRFKQGFGRLIRHSDDRGAVAVLDGRILKKRYGSLFIDSLPDTRKSFKPLKSVAIDIRAFLGRSA